MRLRDKVIAMMALVSMLVVGSMGGAFAESAAPTETASAENPWIAEGELPERLILLVSDDEKDGVLPSEEGEASEKRDMAASVAGIAASALRDTGIELRVMGVSGEAEPVSIDCAQPDAAKNAMNAARGMVDHTENRLDSKLNSCLVELAKESNSVIVLLTDGRYSSVEKGHLQDAAAALQDAANVQVRIAYLSDDEDDTERMETVAKALQDAPITVDRDALDIANFALRGILSEDLSAWATSDADSMIDALGYLDANGNYSVEKPAEGASRTLGTLKEAFVSVELENAVIFKGEPIRPRMDFLEGLNLGYTLTGDAGEAVVTPDENGALPTDSLDAGSYTLKVTGTYPSFGMEASDEVELKLVYRPEPQIAQTTLNLISAPEDPTCFVSEIKRADAFDHDDDKVTPMCGNSAFEVAFNHDDLLCVRGTPDAPTKEIAITLIAQNADNQENRVDLTVNLTYYPAIIREMKLETPSLEDYYREGEAVSFTLKLDEASKESYDALPDEWKSAVCVRCSDGTMPEGDAEQGWSYSADAVKNMTLGFWIADNEEERVPVKPDVYGEDEFVSGALDSFGALTMDGISEMVQPKESVTVRFNLSESEIERLENAPDLDKMGTLKGQYQIGEADWQDAEGSYAEGWTFAAAAEKTARISVRLSYNDTALEKTAASGELLIEAQDIISKLKRQDPMILAIGGAVIAAVLVGVGLLIRALTKPSFHGRITVCVSVNDEKYEGQSVKLREYGKKKVDLGAIIAESGLPPIQFLAQKNVSAKIFLIPKRSGILVVNRCKELYANSKKAYLIENDSKYNMKFDERTKVTLRYNVKI